MIYGSGLAAPSAIWDPIALMPERQHDLRNRPSRFSVYLGS